MGLMILRRIYDDSSQNFKYTFYIRLANKFILFFWHLVALVGFRFNYIFKLLVQIMTTKLFELTSASSPKNRYLQPHSIKSTVLGCLALRATTCCSKGVYLMPVVGFLFPGILVDECLEPFEGFSSVVFVDTASADSISQSDSWVMFSSVLLQISKSSGPLVWNFIFRSSRSTSLF